MSYDLISSLADLSFLFIDGNVNTPLVREKVVKDNYGEHFFIKMIQITEAFKKEILPFCQDHLRLHKQSLYT